MAAVANSQAILCMSKSSSIQRRDSVPGRVRVRLVDPPVQDGSRIVLQPRLCTLRSYGTREGLVRDESSSFFASLVDYVESERKSQDFEIISGRLAMIVFAAAVGVELVTGDSLFKKLDLEETVEAAGVCLAVMGFGAALALASSARTSIGQILTLSCNSFVDGIIDNIVDGLFYDVDPSDWSDEL